MAYQVILLLIAALVGAAFVGESGSEPKDTDEVAVIETGKGRIVVEFYPDKAPKHVENFKALVKEGFYNGTRFHRCIAGFMVQGGDPNTKDLSKSSMWGTGGKVNDDGTRHSVKAEFNDTKHVRGILSMARSQDPNSASSQFFLMVATSPHLDGQYSAFGKVVVGLDVLDEIVKTGDRNNNGKVEPGDAIELKSAKLTTWAEAKKG
ncbi:MAG: peptidylprolyl isomerase [Armatimonadetes bacterium]|nr:peptidylprolyl isomerase [Armatimonadota bacterium]